MAEADANVDASIVLNVLGLRELAVYGFRSWLLQDYDRPYEIVLNLFAPCREMFDAVTQGANPAAKVSVYQYETPEFFNISAANNLGLHKAIGKYVMFANADVIYPGPFLRRAMSELLGRGICYAIAARLNMTAAQSRLDPPMQYTTADRFGSLVGLERNTEAVRMPAISPWMIRRDVAMAIGGFDPKIRFAEDRDLEYRLIHYLRRKDLQQAIISFSNLWGYHQDHTGTGLFNTFFDAVEIMEPRARRLEADPQSTEDCLPTALNDHQALIHDMMSTPKPPLANQYRKDWRGKIRRRSRRVWNALTGI